MVDKYVKTIWENEKTQLNENNMNHIEEGIENAFDYTDAKIKEAITDTLNKNY